MRLFLARPGFTERLQKLSATETTYTETWESGTILYLDQYNRWSGQHVYRRILGFGSVEKLRANTSNFDADWKAEGSIAGKGKPHGEWTYTTYFWDQKPLQLPRTDYTFYWYGEEISEGEWHLRNRD